MHVDYNKHLFFPGYNGESLNSLYNVCSWFLAVDQQLLLKMDALPVTKIFFFQIFAKTLWNVFITELSRSKERPNATKKHLSHIGSLEDCQVMLNLCFSVFVFKRRFYPQVHRSSGREWPKLTRGSKAGRVCKAPIIIHIRNSIRTFLKWKSEQVRWITIIS